MGQVIEVQGTFDRRQACRGPENGQGGVDDSVPDWNDRSIGVSMTVSGGFDLGVDEGRDLLRSSALFADLTLEQLDEVLSRCDVRSVPAGEWCVRAGDPSDGLYIVAYGRLLAYVGDEPGDEISQGQVFGEIGMLARAARTADVRAVRDTELLFLPAPEFDRLSDEHPGWLRRVAQVVVDRLAVPRQRPNEDPVCTITVVPVGEVNSLREVTSALASALGEDGKSVVVDRAEAPPTSDRARWAQRLEEAHRYVVFDGMSDGDDAWTEWCNRHSDRLVLVADATSTTGFIAPPIARALQERVRAGTVILVLLHPSRATRPRPAHEHRRAVGDAPILNVRRGHSGDLARMSRLVSEEAVGWSSEAADREASPISE